MTKVYYGKDSIKPNFLRSENSSETELFRNQIAKTSLRDSESASLDSISNTDNLTTSQISEIEQHPLYKSLNHPRHKSKNFHHSF